MDDERATPSDGRLIGPHLPLGVGLRQAADRAEKLGVRTIQVFTDNPTAWRRRSEPPPGLAEFRARLAAAGIDQIAVHAPYLVNLCGPNDEFHERSVATMANELRVGALYGARFVVMHIGSHRGIEREEGIARLVSGVAAMLGQVPLSAENGASVPRLILENSAGTGDGIGSTVEDLADIFDAMGQAGIDLTRLGVCLDTAHLWGAGYRVDHSTGIEQLKSRVDGLLGRDRVTMIHLNDARTSLGSRLDRHEHIGAGQLGSSGMRALLDDPWLATLPTYLETPGMDTGYDAVNLERVRLLAAGRDVPDLPPEAFALRGSATRTGPPSG
ncbi:deoxyribonuclease IV [soil metagenome]